MKKFSLYVNGYQWICRKPRLDRIFLGLLLMLFFFRSNAQNGSNPVDQAAQVPQKTVVAGKQYASNSFHQWLWGKHYRKEWITPVKVFTINLDSIDGGLTAYESGGGRQSKSLKLRNPQGKEYVIRSIDKTYGKALPEIYQNTFVEKILNDQVSTAHPYSALTIPSMASAAGIFHTSPVIVYIPEQKGLGEFNKEFGNNLYLIEKRADGNWQEEADFGNSSEIVSTDKMFEKVFEESDHRIDQQSFIRARLFDIFVGDWGRHEDQWRWATFDEDGNKIYRPIPRDRDQVYTKFDGVLLSALLGLGGTSHIKTFGRKIEDIGLYNFSARNLDRQAANEVTREQWISTAKELQGLLTDEVIETAVKQLPPEVFPISGNEIISKLKTRRNDLAKYANDYYDVLAREVEVVGTKKKELFKVTRLNDSEVLVEAYDLDKDGTADSQPFYSRKFLKNETEEVRIYGLQNNDQYVVTGNTNKGVQVKIIGGAQKDLYRDSLPGGRNNKLKLYDDANNDFQSAEAAKMMLSEADSVHVYRYDAFQYDKSGLKKILFYNNEDRIHIGVGYKLVQEKWRKQPYASSQELNVKYSLMENAFSTEYKGNFVELVGKWNLALFANYDWIRWINYFGIGNETEWVFRGQENRDYYRMRTRQFYTSVGLNRYLGELNNISFSGFYQVYDIVKDKGRYVAENPTNSNGDDYHTKDFAGGKFEYNYQNVDDVILPTKGVRFLSAASYTWDLQQMDKSFARFLSTLTVYVPLSKSFVYYLKTGGATVTGNPDFYQLNVLGGGQTLRGYRRFRFYGKTMAFAQNEIQWIRNVRGNIFNGRAGLLGLVDLGRVWHPGENSTKVHLSFGGGFIIAPFNKISVAATYAKSREDATINFRFGRTIN